jgi:hypothetical protein
MFPIEERICRNGQTSVPATVGRMQGRTQRVSNDRLACGGGEFRGDLNATSLERYFQGRNAPYSLDDPELAEGVSQSLLKTLINMLSEKPNLRSRGREVITSRCCN